MTTYTTISNALVAVGAKPFATTVQAFRDNPIAIAEGDTSAPVNSPAWHPYDMVLANDGATGRFYDFATNGTQATVTTPTFVNGYDYLVRWVGISGSSNAFPFRIDASPVTANLNAGDTISGYLIVDAPTLTNFPKTAFVNTRLAAGATGIKALDGVAATPFTGFFNFASFGSALTSITFSYGGGNIDAGQFFLYRRRNYIGG